ncbi:serine/threonine-protein kinase [Nocardia pseudovaccinii]|uniref:serine/threonine-protein kinase n=1 Tax=Nocardia pseudovaccinii TaxID=189540 RepID=UPI000A06A56B
MDGTAFGRYRLLELLGAGGMGQVYRAYDTETDRAVALKVLSQHLAHDPKYRERFRREAHAAARLSEPHVIPIHDYGEIDGRLYLDMRLVEGHDIAALLAAGPIANDTAVAYIRQVGSALDAAHRAGLVHRDVKPSNILITAGDFAYLIDFGIAVVSGESSLTTTGAAIGSFAYTAPERLQHGTCDARSDVYSLACVLYQCLTGSQPFPGESVEQQITAHLHAPPPRPSASATVPSAFDAVIARGMAKYPGDRYRTAGDLAAAARAALDAGPTSTATVDPSRLAATRITPTSQPQTRNRPGWTWIVVLAVTAALAWWVISARIHRESPPAQPISVTCVTTSPTPANNPGVPTAPPLGSPSDSCPR